jgi:hypothetical protein
VASSVAGCHPCGGQNGGQVVEEGQHLVLPEDEVLKQIACGLAPKLDEPLRSQWYSIHRGRSTPRAGRPMPPHAAGKDHEDGAHRLARNALLEYVENPTFYGAQPSSVRMLV